MLKIACLAVSLAVAAASNWSYDDIDGWGEVAAVCASGERQSPINVATDSVQFDSQLANDPLIFELYSGFYPGDYFNNGHTIQFTINAMIASNDEKPRISGGGLGGDDYIFEQFHLHWGGNNTQCSVCPGSEHLIDGESAPAEIHFVHFNAKYGTLAEAINHPDGLAVVGFLFQVVNDAGSVATDYTKAADLVVEIQSEGNHTYPIFNFGKLLPASAIDGSGKFYRYAGSLTTPPCSEVVTWTLFDEPIPILAETLDAFKDAETEDVVVKNILNNYRPPQPLNGRVVKSNKRDDPPIIGAATNIRTISVGSLVILAVLALNF